MPGTSESGRALSASACSCATLTVDSVCAVVKPNLLTTAQPASPSIHAGQTRTVLHKHDTRGLLQVFHKAFPKVLI